MPQNAVGENSGSRLIPLSLHHFVCFLCCWLSSGYHRQRLSSYHNNKIMSCIHRYFIVNCWAWIVLLLPISSFRFKAFVSVAASPTFIPMAGASPFIKATEYGPLSIPKQRVYRPLRPFYLKRIQSKHSIWFRTFAMPPEEVSICKMCILSNEKWYEYVYVVVRILSLSFFSSSKSLFLYATVGNKLVFRS